MAALGPGSREQGVILRCWCRPERARHEGREREPPDAGPRRCAAGRCDLSVGCPRPALELELGGVTHPLLHNRFHQLLCDHCPLSLP